MLPKTSKFCCTCGKFWSHTWTIFLECVFAEVATGMKMYVYHVTVKNVWKTPGECQRCRVVYSGTRRFKLKGHSSTIVEQGSSASLYFRGTEIELFHWTVSRSKKSFQLLFRVHSWILITNFVFNDILFYFKKLIFNQLLIGTSKCEVIEKKLLSSHS